MGGNVPAQAPSLRVAALATAAMLAYAANSVLARLALVGGVIALAGSARRAQPQGR